MKKRRIRKRLEAKIPAFFYLRHPWRRKRRVQQSLASRPEETALKSSLKGRYKRNMIISVTIAPIMLTKLRMESRHPGKHPHLYGLLAAVCEILADDHLARHPDRALILTAHGALRNLALA